MRAASGASSPKARPGYVERAVSGSSATTRKGGGIYNSGIGLLLGCTVVENSAPLGPVFEAGSSLVIKECTIQP